MFWGFGLEGKIINGIVSRQSEMKVEMSNPKKLRTVLPASLIFLGWAKFSLSSLVLSLLSFALSLHMSVIRAMRWVVDERRQFVRVRGAGQEHTHTLSCWEFQRCLQGEGPIYPLDASVHELLWTWLLYLITIYTVVSEDVVCTLVTMLALLSIHTSLKGWHLPSERSAILNVYVLLHMQVWTSLKFA